MPTSLFSPTESHGVPSITIFFPNASNTDFVSMAETISAKWRRESVPARLREKGCEAPFFRYSDYNPLLGSPPSCGVFGFWLCL